MCIERLPPSGFGSGNSSNLINTENPEVAQLPDPVIGDDSDTDIESYNGFELDYNSTDEPIDVFNEYMWMENEHEFEAEEIRRLEEEELTLQCLIAMSQLSILDEITQLEDEEHKESVLSDIAQKSSLNPFAAEFFPADAVVVINI